jgi:3' terminal RNA ribose 2'-O-methyltransferase Hen1
MLPTVSHAFVRDWLDALQAHCTPAQLERIVGVDVSIRCLERAHERLRVDEMPPRQRKRLTLIQGSLTYRDDRFAGFDAACLVEVIEHVELSRLAALERVVFEHAQPSHVIVTTPNAEYNVRFESLPAGKLRHRDHRVEWTRAEFRTWAESVAERHGYALELGEIGPNSPVDDSVGAPTQIGVFSR